MRITQNDPKKQYTVSASEAQEQGGPARTRPQSRRLSFDEQGNLVTGNLSAYWIPELSVRDVIHGTAYTVTGSYEGTSPFIRKLERIMARSFSEDTKEPASENAEETAAETEE